MKNTENKKNYKKKRFLEEKMLILHFAMLL